MLKLIIVLRAAARDTNLQQPMASPASSCKCIVIFCVFACIFK
jgi:hypothetical protein